MTKSNRLRGALPVMIAISGAVALPACAPMGAYSGFSKNAMASVKVHRNPDYGQLSGAQYMIVAEHANSCMVDYDRQDTSTMETAGSSGVTYGLAGVVGGEATPVTGAVSGPLNALTGIVAGIGQSAQDRAAFIGACTGADLGDPVTHELLGGGGVHAFPSFTRSINSSDAPPAWTVPAAPAPH